MIISTEDRTTRVYPFAEGELTGSEGYVWVVKGEDRVRFNICLEEMDAAKWARFKQAVGYAFGLIRERRLTKDLLSGLRGSEVTDEDVDRYLAMLDEALKTAETAGK